jgi:enoyl-CoA hydratase
MTDDPYSAEYEYLIVDRVGHDGRAGRITLNRPDRMNALSIDLIGELNEALHALEADYETRVIILRGAGRAFSSGYDLATRRGSDAVVASHRVADPSGRRLVMGTRTGMQQITDFHMYFWNMAKVTIAQVHGYALAGGCELAMMADLVVASEDAQFGHPGNRFGTSRTGVIWPLVIGMRRAKELYYTGASISGSQAESFGMINYAWPLEELEERTIKFADYLANLTSDHLAMLKQNMNRFYENMGIYSSVRSSTDFDAMSQFTAQAYAFGEQIEAAREAGGGLGPAFRWRDDPYRDYWRDMEKPDDEDA